MRIVEVGPRDGLQNEKGVLDVSVKRKLINDLAAAGLGTIEVGSFVSPKWVPQMASSTELFRLVSRDLESHKVGLPCLVPNDKGLDQAISAGVKEIAVFTAASESFNRANINCSIRESLQKISSVIERAKAHGIGRVRGYVSCAIGCPFEGLVAPKQVEAVTKDLLDLGCYEVSLGDTIGIGTPGHLRRLLGALTGLDPERLAVHCHDTYGQALANILVAVDEYGVRVVDASVAGLGGCPYAPGATGNVATEDVVYMLNGLGYETGINLDALVQAGASITKALGRASASRTANALTKGNGKASSTTRR